MGSDETSKPARIKRSPKLEMAYLMRETSIPPAELTYELASFIFMGLVRVEVWVDRPVKWG